MTTHGRSFIRWLLGNDVVRLVVLSRLVTVASAPVTLFLVATLRPAAEQGFYFVFTNLQAVAVLFEFGVGSMLVQFAAHSVHGNGSTSRSAAYLTRAVLHYGQRWFVTAALVVVGVALPSGLFIFGQDADRTSVPYRVPWLVLTLAIGCYLTIIPFLCILEGTGHLRRLQRMRLAQVSISTACLWALIPLIGSLRAAAFASVASLVVAGGWLLSSFRSLAMDPSTSSAPLGGPSDGAALVSAQTRTATSWIVGFLGPQLLAPIVFHYQGAVAAGQVGLSLAAASAPLMFSLSWLQARYPEYGGLVAGNDLDRLDATAKHATLQAVAVFTAGTLAVLGIVAGIGWWHQPLATRFLPLHGVAALSLTSLVYLLYQSMAAHLRAHREESLLGPMTVGTVAAILATIIGSQRDALSAALSYAVAVTGALLPLATAAFVRRRRLLHSRAAA